MSTPGEYRALVTGPRDYTDEQTVHHWLWHVLVLARDAGSGLVIVHGHCPTGVDHMADEWGSLMRAAGNPVRVERHPAQRHPTQDFGPWPGAGPRRNEYMASLGAHICLAFLKPCVREGCPRGRAHDTHGTANCVRQARAYGIEVKEIRV